MPMVDTGKMVQWLEAVIDPPRGSRLGTQHPCWVVFKCLVLDLRNLRSFSGLCQYVNTYIIRYKHTYTKKYINTMVFFFKCVHNSQKLYMIWKGGGSI